MDQQKLPKISVIIPVYNGERYLQQTIQSVLDQTFGDFELVMVDDHSSDCSVEIMKSFLDPRIQVFTNEKNLGIVGSLNRAIALSKAPIIARLDHDDVCFPTRLQKQYAFLEAHPEIGLVGAGIQEIDSEGRKVRLPKIHPSEPYLLKYWLHFEVPLSSPTTTFRRSIMEKAGGFDPAADLSEDYDLYTRFVKYCNISNLDEPLVYKREHGKNASASYHDDQIDRHILISEREVNELMGKVYPHELLENMIDQTKKLDVSMIKNLIQLYSDSSMVFSRNEHLSKGQISRLNVTITWRINALLRRSDTSDRFLRERLHIYWQNHDLFITEMRKLIRKK
jgi:glycosyltransferase involved in cell wall biosynthesis